MKLVTALAALALALACSAVASGKPPKATHVSTPTGLRAFLLSPAEQPEAYYPRTPSFTWNPVAVRSGSYDFQLATSRSFSDSTVLFSYTKIKIPAVAVDHQLPWMTGNPYALWVRVRWESPNGRIVTPWARPFGFNMRWRDTDVPQQLTAPEGLVRWKPIEGATRYEVLFPDLHPSISFQTTTNVADEREFFTLHQQFGFATIRWRVRAIRFIDDKDLLRNGLPRASYGPWSPVFTSVNPPMALGVTAPTATISDTWDTLGTSPHELTPGFAWSPSLPAVTTVPFFGSSLYRVYVFTDNHCVNQVFAGSIVGSPAFAPRTVGGPLALPQDTKALATWDGPPYLVSTGSEGNSFDATGKVVTPNETPGSTVTATGSSGTTSTSGAPKKATDASVDLWDSGWPSGRYYWTVVPVTVELYGLADPTKPNASQPIAYQDTAVAQDQCESGDVMSFGKVSQPVVTSASTPFVAGLSPNGRVISSAAKTPTVHDSPLVSWEPAVGATTYEVQLSRKSYPWRTHWSKITPATSVVIPLTAKDVGTWWYRVRGINPALPEGAQAMTWSSPVRIRISGDRYVRVK
jgi:hypothetical protein